MVSSVLLIIGTIILIAFTPLKEYIPGYSSTALKKKALELSTKTDSLQRIVDFNDKYYASIKKVLKGEVSAENLNKDSIIKAAKIEANEIDLNPIREDSLLREKVDKEDKYSLFQTATSKSSFVLFPPVNGTISEDYNVEEKHYAVDVVVEEDTPIKAPNFCIQTQCLFNKKSRRFG